MAVLFSIMATALSIWFWGYPFGAYSSFRQSFSRNDELAYQTVTLSLTHMSHADFRKEYHGAAATREAGKRTD